MSELDKNIRADKIQLPDEFQLPEVDSSVGSDHVSKADRFSGMFGVLVCTTEFGSKVVLKAFSGQYLGVWNIPGWVPPLFDVSAWVAAVEKRNSKIHILSEYLKSTTDPEQTLERKRKRKRLSISSLCEINGLYKFFCIDGAVRTFSDPFLRKGFPTGTGDCCAPKLLNTAFRYDLHPVSLAEFYYGREPRSGLRKPRSFYPPCDEKCRHILPLILGLEILYRDDTIVVVNKQAGLLSVPGRGEQHQDCVVSRLRRLVPECIVQPSVHRLDQDTSGLLVLALTKEAHRNLSLQFQNGTVTKQYVALVRGKLEDDCGEAVVPGQREGRIELKFRLDPDNRPYQVYDEADGKTGITLWKKIREERFTASPEDNQVRNWEFCTRMVFTLLTGRTHQIRLACSSPHGLGHAIIGDRLYGTRKDGERLMLHAFSMEFTHPVTGKRMSFLNEPDF